MPFTPEQFFGVFAEYNRTMSWMMLALWVAALVAAAAAFRDGVRASRLLTWYLAALWLWNAVAYHALLFTRINPPAWLFAGLFVLQAILLTLAATQDRLAYFETREWRQQVGTMLVVYALFYPLLNITIGHGYPAAPTFGVPCPTAILTLGLLLTTRGPARTRLLIIPVIWGFIAASAALQLGVWADYLLVAAAVLGAVDVISTMVRRSAHLTGSADGLVR